jgi:hypothetical protein
MTTEESDVAQSGTPTVQTFGFLTIMHEPNGYLGGYLVTNSWGRPLEFRLSTAVQPNRIQQILYGDTLQSYLCADLIGNTLVEKTTATAQCIFTDCQPALDLRLHLQVPVVYLHVEGSSFQDSRFQATADSEPANGKSQWPVLCHPRFPADTAAIRQLLDDLDGRLDLVEPFMRIREAMSEARKLGVASRN